MTGERNHRKIFFGRTPVARAPGRDLAVFSFLRVCSRLLGGSACTESARDPILEAGGVGAGGVGGGGGGGGGGVGGREAAAAAEAAAGGREISAGAIDGISFSGKKGRVLVCDSPLY